MASRFSPWQPLFTRCQPDTVILTPNRYLSAHLQTVQTHYRADKRRTWPSPNILPLNGWLEQCWQQYSDGSMSPVPSLMTPHQVHVRWQSILEKALHEQGILQLGQTLQAVQQAQQWIHQWHIDCDHPMWAHHSNGQPFRTWLTHFQGHCAAQQQVVFSELPQHLRTCFQQGHLPTPAHIILVGFEEHPPQIQHLWTILREQGCNIDTFNYQWPTQQVVCLPCRDTNEEPQQLIRWLKQQLAQPDARRIACITLDRDTQHTVQRHLEQHFRPGVDFETDGSATLAEQGVIQMALLVLKTAPCSLAEWRTWLHSPFFDHADTERDARSQLLHYLYEQGETHYSHRSVLSMAQSRELAPHLQQQLATLQYRASHTQSLTQWAQYFSERLWQAGWPGDTTQHPKVQQAIDSWQTALANLSHLDWVHPPCTQQQAYTLLQQLIQRSQLPYWHRDTPIQVLDMLNAAGQAFDAIWVCGVHHDAWPSRTQLNPFIPPTLQRELGIAQADHTAWLQYCEQLTQRLAHSAPEVIFSYPLHAQEQAVMPSPLLRHYPIVNAQNLQLDAYTADDLAHQQWQQRPTLAPISQDAPPPLTLTAETRYGSALLSTQAQCPFRAFAHCRLDAHPLPEPHVGFSPLERGIALHSALEHFWQQTKTQETLLAYSQAACQKLIEEACQHALKRLQQHRPRALNDRLCDLEQQRMTQQLNHWLAQERERPAFTVAAQERVLHCELAGLPFKLRADRIDQLHNGAQLLIDYKTGQVSLNQWFGEQPDAPQLPLYALCDVEFAGLAFAQIRADQYAFKGLAEYDLDIPGLQTPSQYFKSDEANWHDLLAQWQHHLSTLARAFQAGHSAVTPKSPTSCQHCQRHTLCRITQRTE